MSLIARDTVLDDLRRRIRTLETGACADGRAVLPFGVGEIDGVLPERGLPHAAFHEVMGAGADEEAGAVAAAFCAGILARLPGRDGVVWCLRENDLYAPGLAKAGLAPSRLLVVRTRGDTDTLWAMEEVLKTREGRPAAVVGEVEALSATAGRRLQLAAEEGRIMALALRRWRTQEAARRHRTLPSAATTRWRVASLPAASGEPGVARRPRWQVELLRCRGGGQGSWVVEGCDASGHVALPAVLADRSDRPGAAGMPLRRTG